VRLPDGGPSGVISLYVEGKRIPLVPVGDDAR